MKAKALIAAIVCSSAFPAAATVDGWFDAVAPGAIDQAYGWICDEGSPYSTPSGSLAVYLNGVYYTDYNLTSSDYGSYRSDVPAAGFCGGNAYVGWQISGFFVAQNQTIDVYYRFPNNSLQLLGGSGKICNNGSYCQ
jgi:hypothetical protein